MIKVSAHSLYFDEIPHFIDFRPCRLWHTASQAKDSDVIVFGGSCDYVLLVGTYENLTV